MSTSLSSLSQPTDTSLRSLQHVLEALRVQAQTYEVPAFIPSDPIALPYAIYHQVPVSQHPTHRHSQCLTERVALSAAMMAYGNRQLLIKHLWHVLFPDKLYLEKPSQHSPHPYLQASPQTFFSRLITHHQHHTSGLGYRFQTTEDTLWWLELMAKLPDPHPSQKTSTLVALWQKAMIEHGITLTEASTAFEEDAFFTQILDTWVRLIVAHHPPSTYGQRYLLHPPSAHSTRKRLCLFLRWMVRTGVVDLGLWLPEHTGLEAKHLRMPLDTHVAKQARFHGLLSRKSNDWQSVCELTQTLRLGCPEDPLCYEFSLFAPFPKNSTKPH